MFNVLYSHIAQLESEVRIPMRQKIVLTIAVVHVY